MLQNGQTILLNRTMGAKPGKPRFHPTKHAHQYDMIVIGGGPAGIACAREAAKLGAKVALSNFVTKSPKGSHWGIGGTSVNVGSIPKQLMRKSSLMWRTNFEAAVDLGWIDEDDDDATRGKVNWGELVKNIQAKVNSIKSTYKALLAAEKITLYEALGSFKSEHEVLLSNPEEPGKPEEIIPGQCIVIAVGSRPKYLDLPGATEEDNLCITTDDLFSLPYPPGEILIIGGDGIAAIIVAVLEHFESARMMSMGDVLEGSDYELSRYIFRPNWRGRVQKIVKAKNTQDGLPPTLKVSYITTYSADPDNGHYDVELEEDYDTVLLAVGRRPSTKNLNLETIGIKVDDKGYIKTNQFECTNIPHIFAIGDCVKDRPHLTSPAIKAGKYLSRRIYDKRFSKAVDYLNIPRGIYGSTDYAFCGLSEIEAINKFGVRKVQVYTTTITKRFPYVKLVCVKAKHGREKVVGFHCLDENAAEITVGFSMAVKKGCFKDQFDELIGIYKTGAEMFLQMDGKEYRRASLSPVKGC